MSTHLTARLTAAFGASGAELNRLQRQLAIDASQADLLDVAYRTVDSPVGRLLLAATPMGLVRVAFASEGEDVVLQSLADRISSRVLAAPARLDPVARELDDYFAGRRRTFDLPLDRRLSTGFRRTVLERLSADVGYGHTASYTALARLAGSAAAVRAVGSACATNPIPIVVPCHRVIRSDGSTGSYRGGPEAKVALLRLEAS